MKGKGILLVLAVLVSGCLSPQAVVPQSAPSGGTRADEMLRSPPGADVRPTGVTREFTLYLHVVQHEVYPGSRMTMWGFSFEDDPKTATIPGPEIRVTEGDRVVVRFRSLVPGFVHTIHWHGLVVPMEMDGVPYISHPPIGPGEEHVYSFIAKPAGTYWYHCHFDVSHHIQMGMYGAFIVEPQNKSEDPRFDNETTVFLSEMDKYHIEGGNPQTQNFPQSGDPFDWETYGRRTIQDAIDRNALIQDSISQTNTPLRPNRSWYPVTLPPFVSDLNTFLLNGHAFPYTEPLIIDEGKILRIRLINAGELVHSMHLHGHHFLVTHKDGLLLDHPYWADTLLVGPGERYDIYVVGNNPGIWEFHDHIGSHVQNDHIWPGGMMTLLVYRSFLNHASGHVHGTKTLTSGDFIPWMGALP